MLARQNGESVANAYLGLLSGLLLLVHARGILSIRCTTWVTLGFSFILVLVGLLELGFNTASSVLVNLFVVVILVLLGVGMSLGMLSLTSVDDPSTLAFCQPGGDSGESVDLRGE